MRNLMKLIAITVMTALLVFALVTCASADDKIYTSPTFKLPAERLEKAEEIIDSRAEEAGPEEAEEPAEEPEEEPGDEDLGEDEGFEDLEEDSGEITRQVIIRSTQGEVVTDLELITLSSELIGFGEDEVPTYQWQVDRGDGLGWVDVKGGNESKYTYVADRQTVTYSWRLIVTVDD